MPAASINTSVCKKLLLCILLALAAATDTSDVLAWPVTPVAAAPVAKPLPPPPRRACPPLAGVDNIVRGLLTAHSAGYTSSDRLFCRSANSQSRPPPPASSVIFYPTGEGGDDDDGDAGDGDDGPPNATAVAAESQRLAWLAADARASSVPPELLCHCGIVEECKDHDDPWGRNVGRCGCCAPWFVAMIALVVLLGVFFALGMVYLACCLAYPYTEGAVRLPAIRYPIPASQRSLCPVGAPIPSGIFRGYSRRDFTDAPPPPEGDGAVEGEWDPCSSSSSSSSSSGRPAISALAPPTTRATEAGASLTFSSSPPASPTPRGSLFDTLSDGTQEGVEGGGRVPNPLVTTPQQQQQQQQQRASDEGGRAVRLRSVMVARW